MKIPAWLYWDATMLSAGRRYKALLWGKQDEPRERLRFILRWISTGVVLFVTH
jgi:hypothetical protein